MHTSRTPEWPLSASGWLPTFILHLSVCQPETGRTETATPEQNLAATPTGLSSPAVHFQTCSELIPFLDSLGEQLQTGGLAVLLSLRRSVSDDFLSEDDPGLA